MQLRNRALSQPQEDKAAELKPKRAARSNSKGAKKSKLEEAKESDGGNTQEEVKKLDIESKQEETKKPDVESEEEEVVEINDTPSPEFVGAVEPRDDDSDDVDELQEKETSKPDMEEDRESDVSEDKESDAEEDRESGTAGSESDSDVEMQIDASEVHEKSLESPEKLKKVESTGARPKKKEFRNHRLSLTCLCIDSKDKYLFTASKDGSIIKWCLSTRQILNKLNSIAKKDAESSKKRAERYHVLHVNAIAISEDSKFLATGGFDRKVRIWSPDDLTWLHTFTLHRQEITTLAFRRGHHMLYSGSADRSVMIWSLEEDDNRCFVESLIGHESAITCMDTTRKERVLTSGGRDQSIRIWKIVEQAQTVFQSKHQSVDAAKFINDQLFVSGGEDGHLTLWTTMKRSPLCSIKAHESDKKSNISMWISSLATFPIKQTKQHTLPGKQLAMTAGNHSKRKKLDDDSDDEQLDNNEESDDDGDDEDEKEGSDVENTMDTTGDNADKSEGVVALVASGSCDSKVHIWKVVKNNLELHQTIDCPGYINELKFTSDGQQLVAACGKEHKFGRWTVSKGVKNCWRLFGVNKL